jgi:histidinol dehydrogenase
VAGISAVYGIGGIPAIAAMTLGTAGIPKVDKIFGPGNQYVTAAKMWAQSLGIAIDMPAGPSEVLVIAGAEASPEFVAADLLSQAEHGPDSQVMLLSDSDALLTATMEAVERQLQLLPRRDVAAMAISNSYAILLDSLEDCLLFSNGYAPEHLILATDSAEALATGVSNAGSVFVGHYSCESVGDYASGTNHTLPTNGYARSYSGVSLDSFVKKITFQHVSEEGLQNIGPAVELMAAAEGLHGHRNAVSIRLRSIEADTANGSLKNAHSSNP